VEGSLELLETALADRYRIVREIGSGGMATVYLAEDLKHHRDVALKVLRPELAQVLGNERFLREVEVTARLTHPHILALHDSGEAEGFLYYVMPYIEGQSLRDRLSEEGQLPISDAMRICREVASALSYAHDHDVIHRDIKPENVLLSAGEAIVADFGIAKAVSEAGGEHLTETGISIGTPAYMSPEQAVGAGSLDGRSDVYSLGCMLYEMLAGEPPYTAPTHQALLAKKLAEPLPRVSVIREAVPPAVEGALGKALARTPADRFASADEFAAALSGDQAEEAAHRAKPGRGRMAAGIGFVSIIAVATVSLLSGWPFGAGSDGPPRMVVLPFENLGSPSDEHLADGLTDEITSRLANLSGLFVISRTSAMQYKDREMTTPEIGDELNVDYVLEGTVRVDRAPGGTDQIRIIPQLIRVSDDAHLWSEPSTAELVAGDVFRVQAEIAERVAAALDVTLLEPERELLAAAPTDNLGAYEYYVRGYDYNLQSYDEPSVRASIVMFQNAVALDSSFALAYARLGRAHMRMWWLFYDHTDERLAAGREAIHTALRLAPDLPEAHWALGFYHYQGELDYESALAEFEIAQRGRPNSGEVFFAMGGVQRRQGRVEEAAANFAKAAELDPLSALRAHELGETYTLLRKPREAERHLDRAIALKPDWPFPYETKALQLCLHLEGNTEKAAQVLEQAERVGAGQDAGVVYSWILLRMWEGDYEGALERIGSAPSEVVIADQMQIVPKALLWAQVYGLMGNRRLEQVYYDSARALIEARAEQHPDDSRLRSALGLAYAGLGRREDALREGELAVALLPMSTETWRGGRRVRDLARIYTMVGEYDAAIDHLESLLAVPSPMTVVTLRLDPTWAPLRDQPRFQRLLEEYGN